MSRTRTLFAVIFVAALALCASIGSADVADASPVGTFTFFTPPSPSGLEQIVSGPDGNLWFTEQTGGNAIGKITPSGVITEFPVPTASAQPHGITVGSDGNLWFTEPAAASIGRITTAGVITEFPLVAGSEPDGIVTGSDGNLWVTDPGLETIDVFSTAGAILHHYAVAAGDEVDAVVLGPDSNVWFTENNDASISRIDTTGTVTKFSTPDVNSYLAVGSEGNIWFTSAAVGHTGGNINPTTGTVTPVPSLTSEFALTKGPGNNLWADSGRGTAIDEISTAGTVVASYPFPAGYTGSYLPDLTAGPDGKVWFLTSGGQVGVFDPTAAPAPAHPVLATTGIGDGWWQAGGLALGALALGMVARFIAHRRPARSAR